MYKEEKSESYVVYDFECVGMVWELKVFGFSFVCLLVTSIDEDRKSSFYT
jgi:hypothetical protein